MKLFLASYLLLSTMISTGYSLTCISCTGTEQTPCTGSAVTCASTEDVCTSIYTETKIPIYRMTSYAIVRGCGVSSECNIPKSLSNQFMAIDINTGCCQANNCTPTAPIVSSGNTDTNGLVCPSCFTLTSSTCVSDSQINCTGSENRCTSYSISSVSDPPKPIMAMAGCATENMCSDYNGTATTSITGQMAISIGCSNATLSPYATSSSTVSPSGSQTSGGSEDTSHAKTQSYYFTTDIINSYPSSNSSDVYYTTRITFTPTTFQSTVPKCVCNGCGKPHFGLVLIATLSLFKCFL